MLKPEVIIEFWGWFDENRDVLETMLSSGEASKIAELLPGKIKSLHPNLGWEMGPGKNKPFMLTLMCYGFRETANSIISFAPKYPEWEFYSARQPKDPPPKIRFPDDDLEITTLNWKFTPNTNRAGNKFDITIIDPDLARLNENRGMEAIFILLDALIGEDAVSNLIGIIEISPTEKGFHPIYPILALPRYLEENIPPQD